MKEHIQKNREIVKKLIDTTSATDKEGKAIVFEEAMENTIHLIVAQSRVGKKLMFIGNGASAAISSHIATDFWRNVNIRAMAFNDPSLLTCISNDYGYIHVFEKSIEMFADKGDILIAISSSGRSENILKGVEAARKQEAKVITFSGFTEDNPLKKFGDINFYVPSQTYGHVEVVHHFLCHSLINVIMQNREKLQLKEFAK